MCLCACSLLAGLQENPEILDYNWSEDCHGFADEAVLYNFKKLAAPPIQLQLKDGKNFSWEVASLQKVMSSWATSSAGPLSCIYIYIYYVHN